MAAMTSSAVALRWHRLDTLQRPECLPRVSCCFGENLERRHGERIASGAERSHRRRSGAVACSASDEPPSSASTEISGALGGLIATTRLIAALSNPAKAGDVPEISKGLIIDIGAVSAFAFLFSRENATKNAQLVRLSREKSLSKLKLRIDEKRIIPVSSPRGATRLVICAGPASFITGVFKLSEPYTNYLLERGVLMAPFPTDGNTPSFKFGETEVIKDLTRRRRRLWQLTLVYATEWSRWLEKQKKLAGVSLDSPVYLSLRMDGRVHGSGVGYPSWNAFVVQLLPVKSMWSGLLDGMDGRVL